MNDSFEVVDAEVPEPAGTGALQTSALKVARQQDPAVGGSYIRKVETGEVIKHEPVRELKEQE